MFINGGMDKEGSIPQLPTPTLPTSTPQFHQLRYHQHVQTRFGNEAPPEAQGVNSCTEVSQEAGQVVWYSHLFQNFPQLIVIHTVKGFGIVNKADFFLELSYFFDDPSDVGNLISGSSAFSKTSLNIWKFMVHVLLKPGLENFEHYFTSV